MSEYGSNSNKSKKETVKPVVKGKTKIKKNYKKMIISDDAGSVGNYVFSELLIPSVKKVISEGVKMAIDRILYGGDTPSSNYYRDNRNTPYVSYSRMSSRDDRGRHERTAGYSPEDVIFTSRADANEVLAGMDEILDRYGVLSVAEYKDLAGVQSSYTDAKFGWTSLNSASVLNCRDGYYIKLPRPYPIDR